MKLGINIAIAVVLVLLLLSRPVVLSEMMQHGLVKAVMLCLVVITTVRETCLGVLAAVVFVVLSENVYEGLALGPLKITATKNDKKMTTHDDDKEHDDKKHDDNKHDDKKHDDKEDADADKNTLINHHNDKKI